jgi:hypothetical protein
MNIESLIYWDKVLMEEFFWLKTIQSNMPLKNKTVLHKMNLLSIKKCFQNKINHLEMLLTY